MDNATLPWAELLSVYGMSGAGLDRLSEQRGGNALLDAHLADPAASYILISDPGLSTQTVAGVIEGPTTAFPAPSASRAEDPAHRLLWSPPELAEALELSGEDAADPLAGLAERIYQDEAITAAALGCWSPRAYTSRPTDGAASPTRPAALKAVLEGHPVVALLIRPQRLALGADQAAGENRRRAETPDHAAGDGAEELRRSQIGQPVRLREAIFAVLEEAQGCQDPAHEAAWLCLADALTAATAICAWHHSHLFSPRTGEVTRPVSSGWARADAEGRESFPRQDMAVIVAVTDAQGRLLLGRNAHWPPQRYSCFAGFVDAGESVEAAAVRELWEEAGVRASRLEFFGSQPWPFPRSMMLGFHARTEDEPRADGQEILDVRAFTREELARAQASGEVSLPSPRSISFQLIRHWQQGG